MSAIRAESNIFNYIRVAGQGEQFTAGRRIPNLRHVVLLASQPGERHPG